jgi:MazG family protein
MNIDNLKGLDKLKQITVYLRSSQGCPWDKKQNPKSLVPLFIEEVYELIQSILDDNFTGSQEELGDVLFHVLLLCHILSEQGGEDIDGIAEKMSKKLIRRHPHVFGENKTKEITPDKVLKNWEAIKASEKLDKLSEKKLTGKEKRELSIFSGVPIKLPSLLQAERIQEKASKIGFDWKNISGPREKIQQELQELLSVLPDWKKKPEYEKEDQEGPKEKIEDELGDLLFSLVNYARFLKVSPEIALIKTIKKFKKRFSIIEEETIKRNRPFGSKNPLSPEEMDEIWENAKKLEKN